MQCFTYGRNKKLVEIIQKEIIVSQKFFKVFSADFCDCEKRKRKKNEKKKFNKQQFQVYLEDTRNETSNEIDY